MNSWASSGATYRAERAEARAREVEAATSYLQELAEWLLSLRAETISFAAALDAADGDPVTGGSLERMRLGTKDHVAAREEVLDVIAPFRDWHRDRSASLALEADTRRKGVLLATTGASLLYDNFALAVAMFESSGRLRRILNRADSGFGLDADQLLQSIRLYYSPAERDEFRAAVGWLEKQSTELERQAAEDEQVRWLWALLKESRAVSRIGAGNGVRDYLAMLSTLPQRWLDHFDTFTLDTSQAAMSGFLAGGSQNSAVHRGALKPTPELLDDLKRQLQPLDVLLDKSRWRGSIDALIPGYFTHVALWLGTPEDFLREGVWDSPTIRPHQPDIAAGRGVLEAVRSGVRLTDLPSFLNLDELVILRPRALTSEERRAALQRALRQVGKEYDFHFDVETTDRVVCSEVPYLVFTQVSWRTSALAGRATISPDNVAKAALDGGPFEVVKVWAANGELSLLAPEAALRRLLAGENKP